jgi:hypothetical protein
MIKFDVLNRFTGAVQFTAEIDCDESELTSIKLGLAIQWGYDNKKSLKGAYMARANLARANLAGADLARANLEGANLAGADLARANLEGAYMEGANLARADLENPPVSFGCVGHDKRTGFAVWQNDCVMVRLGCFWDKEEKAYEAIRKKYGEASTYEALVLAACEQVRWYKAAASKEELRG